MLDALLRSEMLHGGGTCGPSSELGVVLAALPRSAMLHGGGTRGPSSELGAVLAALLDNVAQQLMHLHR